MPLKDFVKRSSKEVSKKHGERCGPHQSIQSHARQAGRRSRDLCPKYCVVLRGGAVENKNTKGVASTVGPVWILGVLGRTSENQMFRGACKGKNKIMPSENTIIAIL